MATDTSVRFVYSGMRGAPQLDSAPGSGLALLVAALVNGFGSTSITSASITGGVCTVVITAGAVAPVDSVVSIAGLTPIGLNGDQKVVAATATTVSFATTETGPVTTSSATIKAAPLGWTQPFTGTNAGVFKSGDPAGTGCYLNVIDTAEQIMSVAGYETMTAQSVGTGKFPTDAQMVALGVSASVYMTWRKSTANTQTARPWFIIGDARAFYLGIAPQTNLLPAQFLLHYFGDITPEKSGDAYACSIVGLTTAFDAVNLQASAIPTAAGDSGQYMPRAYHGLGGSIKAWRSISGRDTTAVHSGGDFPAPYPNPVNNGLSLMDLMVMGGNNLVADIRGYMPGLRFCVQNLKCSFQTGDRLDKSVTLDGKSLIALKVDSVGQGATNLSYPGAVFFDTTGPWRT